MGLFTLCKNFVKKVVKRCFIYCLSREDIIKADFIHTRRTSCPTKIKIGIPLEELK